jgi:hypothetical protein
VHQVLENHGARTSGKASVSVSRSSKQFDMPLSSPAMKLSSKRPPPSPPPQPKVSKNVIKPSVHGFIPPPPRLPAGCTSETKLSSGDSHLFSESAAEKERPAEMAAVREVPSGETALRSHLRPHGTEMFDDDNNIMENINVRSISLSSQIAKSNVVQSPKYSSHSQNNIFDNENENNSNLKVLFSVRYNIFIIYRYYICHFYY